MIHLFISFAVNFIEAVKQVCKRLLFSLSQILIIVDKISHLRFLKTFERFPFE